jgi:hypothetical protein
MRLGFVIAAMVIAGCGGASSSSLPSSSEGEPSAQFLKTGKGKEGNAKIVKFGEEASAEEREAARAVVAANAKDRQDCAEALKRARNRCRRRRKVASVVTIEI